ncbi:TIGR04283 family arsenosugar biosynthesis glycosyltransferase [Piscinibacter sp.]|uniref:TIGR04283 family arsenosugar biosynthesis glycosyltransferase n=1 Tax=Piscinibacter sp. TaxID=1903157 RepID=UPI002C2C8DAC|nr:TIGR04283 family arsenosugar biosynthesis glycosyltransferase [Albitalea sp.]HUG21723.1 TIGR04283 family arsenosugar biosynthesis glycosyltransferase [Albitalea sp.]
MSIIIPVVDEAGTIASCLNALAACRAEGTEVIVVDGGSRDTTVESCAGLADRVLQAPRGRARQMNAGAQAAEADVLLFLHADTRLPDGALPAVEQALASGAAKWGRFDVCIAGRSQLFPLIAGLMNRRSRWSGIATGDQAIFVRRDSFVAVGGFPDQPLMEDIELSRRLRRRGRPACLRPPVVTSGRRWERDGVWRTIILMWRLRLLYWLGAPAERLARAYR